MTTQADVNRVIAGIKSRRAAQTPPRQQNTDIRQLQDAFLSQDFWKAFTSAESAAIFANSLKTNPPVKLSLESLNERFWNLVADGSLRPDDNAPAEILTKYRNRIPIRTARVAPSPTASLEQEKRELKIWIDEEYNSRSARELQRLEATDLAFRAKADRCRELDLIWSPVDWHEAQRAALEAATHKNDPDFANDPATQSFVESYRQTSAGDASAKYRRDPEYRKTFDRCIAAGLI